MTFRKAWVATGLALAICSAPASAADFGGIKDIGGGVPVPVPAPAPVPTYDVYSDWYVGLAIGANVLQDATIEDSDINMPVKDSSDIGASAIFGLNFGRYITPSLRAEIAIDYSRPEGLTDDGHLSYLTQRSNGTNINNYAVDRSDSIKLSRTTGLVNLLYDFDTGTRFKPYIGGGVGFSWRQIRRNFSETSNCNATPEFPTISCGVTNIALQPSYNFSSSNTKNQLDFAAAVQAGIGYEINEWITWDNGWQMLWEGGAIASSEPSVSGENRITFKDSVLQQFRSGLRIKFD